MSFLSRIMVLKSQAHFSAGVYDRFGAPSGMAIEGSRKRKTGQAKSRVGLLIVGFTALYAVTGAADLIGEMLMSVGGHWGPIIAMQAIFLIMGMFFDPTGIVLLTTPIFFPVVIELGFDPLWFGILFIINMEMAFLTPPFGFNLFYMKAVVPPGVTMMDIYKSVIPFVLLQLLCLIICMIFPGIVTWLPYAMLGK